MSDDDLEAWEWEQAAVHLGKDGPVAAATEWLLAVCDDELFEHAWNLSDDDVRMCLVQASAWANHTALAAAGHDLDTLASNIVELGQEHSLWEPFVRVTCRDARQSWGAFDPEAMGALGRPRPIGVDLELVYFAAQAAGAERVLHWTTLEGIPVLLRRSDDGWQVAGFSDEPVEPGWPPDWRFKDRLSI